MAYNETILEQIPQQCDTECPLNGIPMSEYLGKGNCESCKYFPARNAAYNKYFASWEDE